MTDVRSKIGALLARLPEDCTFDDVLYHVYVLRQVERGLADVEAGRTTTHAEIEEELRRGWQVGRAG